MRALGGIERAWSGARPRPKEPAPSRPVRCRVVGGRIGLVIPEEPREALAETGEPQSPGRRDDDA
ncbi:hypothetical protein [Actinocorallia sp. A-T 12471]|uniref:hypothetical protein n=1 Tax=Actinocorallia sp. A-T 12471 TaxID=3089813 RepID=UPI0029D25CC0|nr:hypothetical protein [Actinocorallia sp. A-T 12471]MDX6741180.1 hypothetical protein [Actinocorallia sp. A-T 12471]